MQQILLQIPPSVGTLRILPSSTTLICCTGKPESVHKMHQRKLPRRPRFPSRLNHKSLTSRIVQLTRRRQLTQIFQEIEIAKSQYGNLGTIVMNAVMQACIHCDDIDSALEVFGEMSKLEGCGVDNITYGTLLKGLGNARRIDEAFQMLESVEKGTAVGSPQLSVPLICGLLNALIEAGDLRRSNGLLARYSYVFREGGSPSILAYNLLMKGYISVGCPHEALSTHDEILRQGLNPDRLTYNTLIFACVKMENLDAAMLFFEQMKDKAQKDDDEDIFPDLVTYTTLLQGFGRIKNLPSVKKIMIEMKTRPNFFIDRVAYTVIVDAFLNCGSIKGALCVFGEIIKQAAGNRGLRPKPHLYLSLMRAFAARGDYEMLKRLHGRMWLDTVGTISSAAQVESDHLLMEAALNDGQVDLALQNLKKIVGKWKDISWTSRGGMVALRLEALLGLNSSLLSPRLLLQVSVSDAIEHIMTPFDDARPLQATLQLKQMVMRFFNDPVVPIIDDWGGCVGILHREDCDKLDAPLSTLMRSPPPCVTASTSIGCVINLMLEKKYKMVIVVKYGDFSSISYGSSVRAAGIFTYDGLCKLANKYIEENRPAVSRFKCKTKI
ncbi:pentatricopeptide repeat-containing At5g10690 [Olea europaea subsp. europaea]|uniref:Pentatricopeptide repeat-containing At5g10690 n=1 Tax=Olea europaea subsp. europaea TaxID=158383 RepID=A0A8S0S736_OLEEU|nr:pentatricopeptide repeat-containing At5g10690 [Olea europaea subsp. europaea]